jgi:hypothetical protein
LAPEIRRAFFVWRSWRSVCELILRKLQQLSVVVEATLVYEEMATLAATPPTA